MAKTIKFNLICDNHPVRTIEDLQNNFSIEDMLHYYENGLLAKWLQVRGYTQEYEKVASITSAEPMQIIKRLIDIFDIPCDNEKTEESVRILEDLREIEKSRAKLEPQNYKIDSVVNGFISGYNKVLLEMVEHPDDEPMIKAAIKMLTTYYSQIFAVDHRHVFYTLYDISPLAIMCLLMDETARIYYLGSNNSAPPKDNSQSTIDEKDAKEIRTSIVVLSNQFTLKNKIPNHLKIYSGCTNDYWQDIEPKGKKFMIIHIYDGDFVRPTNKIGGDLSAGDVNTHFPIIDGIDYKSWHTGDELLYMEV